MIVSFIEELDHVQADLLKMGSTVQSTIAASIDCLRNKDVDTAKRIIASDDVIDNQQIVVEEGVAGLLSLQVPVGSDLRRLMSFIKIAADLERIGDYANNIAEIALELRSEEYIKPLVHIPQLSSMALAMLETSLQAFVTSDSSLAEAVCRKDEEADNLYRHIYEELIGLLTSSVDQRVARQAPRFMRVAEYLERVAGHATNIAENTIYMVTGRRVRF